MIMDFIPIVDRVAFIAATLYDIFHVPSSPYSVLPYAYYVSGFGEIMYTGYYIEKHDLWEELIHRILGLEYRGSNELDKGTELIRRIEIPFWKEISESLVEIHPRVSRLYRALKQDIINTIRKVFGFQKLFKRIYVIYGFSPLPKSLYGSMLYWSNDYVIVSIYVNDMHEPEKVIDIMIHEVLHGLMRLNNIELRDDIEELLIDISCPEGYLSKILGLSMETKVDEIAEKYEDLAELASMAISYYENKIYDEDLDIIKWITSYINDRRLPII